MLTAADWYLALYSLGVGASVAAFWFWVVATGRLGTLGEGRDDFAWHAAAEVAAGAILLVAGVGLLADPDARWPDVLTAAGLGSMVYALVESAGHYLARGFKIMVGSVVVGWVFTVPALVLRFLS